MYKYEFFADYYSEGGDVAIATVQLPATISLRNVQSLLRQMETSLEGVMGKQVHAQATEDSLTIPFGYHGSNRFAITMGVDHIRSLAEQHNIPELSDETIHKFIDRMHEEDITDNVFDEFEDLIINQLKTLPHENKEEEAPSQQG